MRRGVWRNRINYWLPLSIDSHHFAKAKSSLHQTLRVLGTGYVAEQTRSSGPQVRKTPALSSMSMDDWLARRAKASASANKKFKAFLQDGQKLDTQHNLHTPVKNLPAEHKPMFEPSIVLDMLPKLMNSQVVLLMKGEVWASQKALSGYMAFHHLLLSTCHENPAIQLELEERIRRFCSSEDARVKSKVPNLGEFICLLSASDEYDWQSVATPLLSEVFDRNVLWLLKKHPDLGKLRDFGVCEERLRRTFQCAVVSMRLIMFNVWFLNNIANKGHGTGISAVLARYERTKGVPPGPQIAAVQQAVRRICEVCTWDAYFDALGIQRIAPDILCTWLRRSVMASLRKGYHRASQGRWQMQSWRETEEENRQKAIDDLADHYD